MSDPIAYNLSCLGIACSLGLGKEQVIERLLAGDQSGLMAKAGLFVDQSVQPFVGEVPDDFLSLDHVFATQYRKFDSRNNRLLLSVYLQIEAEVQEAINTYGKDRVAIVLGTSTSGVEETEKALAFKSVSGEWPEGYDYSQQEFGDPAHFLATYLGLSSPCYVVSTACSSSAKVFGSARRLLESGLCDAVIVGGVDTLCRLTVNGFASLESISRSICDPFSKTRDGINIGEAAALFVMTQTTTAQPEDVYFLGIGESSDAHHISAPQPEGKGAIAAMQAAMNDAHITAEDVAYINMHGTATPQNDAMESIAVSTVLGASTHASSTKSMTGHTLGAAGALEAAFCWLILSRYNVNTSLPPQVMVGERDESLADINLVLQPGVALPDGVLMSNSFAFGGSNASLVFGKGCFIR